MTGGRRRSGRRGGHPSYTQWEKEAAHVADHEPKRTRASSGPQNRMTKHLPRQQCVLRATTRVIQARAKTPGQQGRCGRGKGAGEGKVPRVRCRPRPCKHPLMHPATARGKKTVKTARRAGGGAAIDWAELKGSRFSPALTLGKTRDRPSGSETDWGASLRLTQLKPKYL